MRIADILMDADDDDFGDSTIADIAHRRRRSEDNRNFECLSPWSIFSRWLSCAKKSKRQRSLVKIEKLERERRSEKVDGEFGRERKEQTKCSMKGKNDESSPSVSEELNGDCRIAEMSDVPSFVIDITDRLHLQISFSVFLQVNRVLTKRKLIVHLQFVSAPLCLFFSAFLATLRTSMLPSGQYIKEASFNLGAGFGLIYLIATRTNELSKMMELRTQMEMLLQNVKEELQNLRTDILSKTSDPIGNNGYSTIDAQESLYTNGNVSLQNLTPLDNISDSEIPMLVNQSLNSDTSRQERRIEEMDQLEAELEVELERLQRHLDTEAMLENSKQQRMEMPFEDSAPEESFSGSAEVLDPPEDDTREHWPVPPNELERRLHELLEARQQERIKELEAALECARLKLYERDTARFISQRVPESYHLLR
ncbi:protein POLAR-like 1 [Cornus florida]|uniref:protein POLAR-like 1 n=1 Tax=Cornus florida TaxID=4283 RepID=UPI0028A05225|nr:protein POLAR-like 1 [Cornus florida]